MLLTVIMAFAGAQTAGADINLTPHITYGDGLSSSNVTIQATTLQSINVMGDYGMGDNEIETKTLTDGSQATFTKGTIIVNKIRIAVTSSEDITVTYSGVEGLTQSGTDCSFSASDGKSYTINITVGIVPKYTVHFDANATDATGTMDDQTFTVGVAQSLTANSFSRTNYVFAGWNTESNGTGTAYADKASVKNLATTAGATVTLYAQWVHGYIVSFDKNLSDAVGTMANQTFLVGEEQALSPCGFTANAVTSAIKYVFAGWNTKANGSGVRYADGQVVKDIAAAGETITLYATWQQVLTFTVHFDANGGEGTMADQIYSILYSENYLPSCTFSRSGYIFAGWNTKADGSGKAYSDGAKINQASSITLYAQWTALPPNCYGVHFNRNNDNASGTMADQVFTVGVAQALTANAFTYFFSFSGWNTKADGSGVSYSNGQVVTDIAAEGETITLYAQWQDKSVHIYLTVRFNANGGEGYMANQMFKSGEEKNLNACTFTRAGYRFTGWNTEADGSGEAYNDQENIRPGENITLYAQWELEDDLAVNGNTYTINTAAGWGQFCDLLDGGTSFTGKTVKLGNSITVTRPAGSDANPFCGTFDGQQHTLTVNITDTENQGTAPFRFISNATIRNLHVTGSVTGTAHASGLVGKACAGTILIENCLVEANVNSTVGDTNGNKHCGGIVGHGFGGNNPVSLTLRNCVYAGTITCDKNYIGGLQGWSDGNTLTLENCLFAGNYAGKDGNTALFHPIALHNTGSATNLTATNVFTAVAATVTNANFIAADGTKTTGRTSAPANLGTQGATYNYMNTTVYEHGLLYNGLYYVAPTLSTDTDNAYLINNEDDWTNFCDALYDNGTWNRFSGKTVKLGANIGTAQNPVTRMAGTSNHDFCGTFDGQGHTLTFTSNENIDGVAPFSYVSETTPTGGTEVSHPVIRNLNVVADINTTAQYASALVGRMWCTLTIEGCTVGGTIQTSDKYAAGFIAQQNGDASITDCRSSVTIQSSVEGDGNHGGFVALPGGTLNITGCLFTGKLLTTGATTSCGGFVGYGACNITSSLYAPAAIAQDETEARTDESATFARGTASGITIANCYYTRELNDGTNNTAQGKALCTANAAPAGVATHALYTVSGITPYANGITRTVGDATTFYYGGGDIVSAPYVDENGQPASHAATALSPAHMPATLTANFDSDNDQTADQGWYYVADDIEYTQTVTLAADATLILADGKTMSVVTSRSSCIVSELDNKNPLYALTIYGQSTEADQCGTLSAYSSNNIAVYVKNYAQHGGNVTANGNDGIDGVVTMTGGTLTATGIYAIYGRVTISGGTLTAKGTAANSYGISGGVTMTGGDLTANGRDYGISGGVTMTGGTLTARGTNANSYGIGKTVRFSGGNFYAWAPGKGINGNVTLGWTSATDRFYASSFGGTVMIANGKHFHNGSEVLDPGSVTDMTKLDGKTLRPFKAITLADNADNSSVISEWNGGMANVTLQGRKLWKDGAWNTLVLPFAIADEQIAASPLAGADIRALSPTIVHEGAATGFDPKTGTLTLNFTPAAPASGAVTAIQPGVPYIVKWGNTEGTEPTEGTEHIVNPVFSGVTVSSTAPADRAVTSTDGYVTFVGTYAKQEYAQENQSILFLGTGNNLYYPQPSDGKLPTIGAFRAYFQLVPPEPGSAQVRAFVLNFGDASESQGIKEIEDGRLKIENEAGAWYDLQGRRMESSIFNSQSSIKKKGLYIHGGRKVVIK